MNSELRIETNWLGNNVGDDLEKAFYADIDIAGGGFDGSQRSPSGPRTLIGGWRTVLQVLGVVLFGPTWSSLAMVNRLP